MVCGQAQENINYFLGTKAGYVVPVEKNYSIRHVSFTLLAQDGGLYYAGIFCTLFRDINLTSDGRSYGIRKLEFSYPNLCIL